VARTVVRRRRVRDSALLAPLHIGIKALGPTPARSAKTGAGQEGVPVGFGSVAFRPGTTVVSNEDGIVVLP
jgi:regulator of ribonuclease activity A